MNQCLTLAVKSILCYIFYVKLFPNDESVDLKLKFFFFLHLFIYTFFMSRLIDWYFLNCPCSFMGGVNNQRSLHPQYHDWGETLEQGTEPPTAPQAPQHWLPTAPGVCSRWVCVHCCVCALGWVNCRAQIPSMGHHTWPHFTSLVLKMMCFVGWDGNVISEILVNSLLGHYEMPVCIENCCIKKKKIYFCIS